MVCFMPIRGALRRPEHSALRRGIRGFREYREWVRAPGYEPYPQEVAAALESDDPRAALLALAEQGTGVQLSDGSS